MRVLLNITDRELASQGVPGHAPGRARFQNGLLALADEQLEVRTLPTRPPLRYLMQTVLRRLPPRHGRLALAERLVSARYRLPVDALTLDQARCDVLHADLTFVSLRGHTRAAIVYGSHGIVESWYAHKHGSYAELAVRTAARMLERFADESDLIVCSTHAGIRGMRNHTSIAEEKIAYAPMHFLPALPGAQAGEPCIRREDGPRRVVFVGSNPGRKGMAALLVAATQVWSRFPEAEVHIVGRTDPGAIPHGLSGSVVAHGLLTPIQVALLLRRCDIFVQPTLADTYYISAVEAMSEGLPVILSNRPPHDEILEEGITGHSVDPGDTDRLAALIIELLGDESAREAMGAAARRRVKQMFGAAHARAAWKAVYERATDLAVMRLHGRS